MPAIPPSGGRLTTRAPGSPAERAGRGSVRLVGQIRDLPTAGSPPEGPIRTSRTTREGHNKLKTTSRLCPLARGLAARSPRIPAQLSVLDRSHPRRLRLSRVDRLLWVWFSRVWCQWWTALVIVKPETVSPEPREGGLRAEKPHRLTGMSPPSAEVTLLFAANARSRAHP